MTLTGSCDWESECQSEQQGGVRDFKCFVVDELEVGHCDLDYDRLWLGV